MRPVEHYYFLRLTNTPQKKWPDENFHFHAMALNGFQGAISFSGKLSPILDSKLWPTKDKSLARVQGTTLEKGKSGGHKKWRLTPPTSTFQINRTSPTPKFELLVRRKLENKPYTLQQIWKKKREWGVLMLKLVKIAFLLPSGCNTCGDNGNNAKIYCLHPPSEGFWR